MKYKKVIEEIDFFSKRIGSLEQEIRKGIEVATEEVSSGGDNPLTSVVQDQARVLLDLNELSVRITEIKKAFTDSLVMGLEGQRGSYTFGDATVDVTMKSSKRKFNDSKVLDLLADAVQKGSSKLLNEFSKAVEDCGYVSYWRTKNLTEWGIDIDEVSTFEVGSPTVTVKRTENG
ncbi:hypothetical protein UFOVP978_52 [uncultured Caudovirales phage]|uniref:Uncharacterized protein n=1 Tax=uncultured Caudovirales phage TaxID=2100421 RepID=A0A6J5Q1X5_9CAUD|nr:hypothetical protein UFOVP978_52 [uncultured Caudovirales phage]